MASTPIVVCPQCQSLNRVPSNRLQEHPQCGKCHAALQLGEVLEVDSAALARHIQRGTLPVLVDFWAPWCGPCRMMAPYFAHAAREHLFLRFLKVDIEQYSDAAQFYQIRSIPTLVLFINGSERARHVGALDARALHNWLMQHLSH